MYKFIAAGAFVVGLTGAASAATVDFGEFTPGQILSLNTDFGDGIVADVSAMGGVAQAVVFDTENAPSIVNDPDLANPFTNSVDPTDTRRFDNALIVQENNPGTPDDAVGGSLTFEFTSILALTDIYLLDTEAGSFVELFLDGISVDKLDVTAALDSDTNNTLTNNEFTLLDFEGAQGNKLVVSFLKSGALGEFEAAVVPPNTPAVPLPAGLPLLLAGLGAFAVMRRTKRA
ncbi:MAG: VPLPA-CTERM sorting domain-containing protein [Pseudomonadota bacterium]